MGKRLFVAVDIDEPTREAVGGIAAAVRGRIGTRAKLTWVRPDRMHLTLHFVGDADEKLESRLRGVLAHAVPQAPFDLSFEGVGFFPSRGSPRVLWLGIGDGLADLGRLYEAIRVKVEPTGSQDAAYQPHLTLARFRDRMPRGRIAEIANIPASAGPCRIDRVTLYESRLSPTGPAYQPLAEAPLRPSGSADATTS